MITGSLTEIHKKQTIKPADSFRLKKAIERLSKRTCTCTSTLVRGTRTRHCNVISRAVKQTSRVRVRVEPRCYQSADWSALIHKPVSFIVFYVVFEIIMAEKVVLAALENDDDLLLLSSLKEEKVLAYQKLDIDNLTNDQCRTMFRFEREDINILSNALRLPETIICNNVEWSLE